ncbi:hypothetical protein [Blastomonas sp. CCH13-E1]|jgi:hypothetical protein
MAFDATFLACPSSEASRDMRTGTSSGPVENVRSNGGTSATPIHALNHHALIKHEMLAGQCHKVGIVERHRSGAGQMTCMLAAKQILARHSIG